MKNKTATAVANKETKFDVNVVPIDSIKPNEDNPRSIKDKNLKKLVNSIIEFPQMLSLRPIIVDDNDVILAGNMRHKAAKIAGLTDIPVIKASSLTQEQTRQFIVKDNASFGDWEIEKLLAQYTLEELDAYAIELPELELNEDVEVEDDNFNSEQDVETSIVEGDLIEIGSHRLLCGDATILENVEKVLPEKQKAQFVFTDPPFDIKDQTFAESIYFGTENAHVFVMHDDKGIVEYLRKSVLNFRQFFVADFVFSSPRGNDPYLKHILISHESKGEAIKHVNHHDGLSSILKMQYRGTLKEEVFHSHQKPVDFVATFVKHYSKEHSIVLDLFAGSGTTIVASHKLNRRCSAIELDPKNCQRIIDRMKKLDTTIVVKVNGVQLP